MNRTSIKWVLNPDGSRPGWSWSPITGCLNHVNGLCNGGGFPCYAYKLAHGRLKQKYLANDNLTPCSHGSRDSICVTRDDLGDPFYPRFWEDKLFEFNPVARTSKGIFVCDMSDLFGIGIPDEWTSKVIEQIKLHPEHRFYLLTKQPQNLIKFSPFPENTWVGVTITNEATLLKTTTNLGYIDAKVKFISFEPLLERLPLPYYQMNCDWLIIGACTGSAWDIGKVLRKYPDLEHKPYGSKWTAQPEIEWVREIVEAANKARIPVFLKDNLRVLLPKEPPFYTTCCADINGKDPCYEEPCLSGHDVDECSKAPNFWMLHQEMPDAR